MGMEWDGAAAVWMRRACSHSRQCGLAAKVSGRTDGATRQQQSPIRAATRVWKRPSAISVFWRSLRPLTGPERMRNKKARPPPLPPPLLTFSPCTLPNNSTPALLNMKTSQLEMSN